MTTISIKNPAFADIFLARKAHIKMPSRILALDPGETMGVAVIHGDPQTGEYKIEKLIQIKIKQSNNIALRLQKLLDDTKPEFVVFENYRVYGTHAKQHINSELFTPQLIGRIKSACELNNKEYAMMMASQSKAFVTDDRLVQWGMIKGPSHEFRHCIDAARVGLTYLLFQ